MMLAFFRSGGKEPEINTLLNIISKGLQIASLHNFNMSILKLSRAWSLLGSRLRIIFPISSAENEIVDKRLGVR